MVQFHRPSDERDIAIGYRSSSVCMRDRGWSERSTLVDIALSSYPIFFEMSKHSGTDRVAKRSRNDRTEIE